MSIIKYIPKSVILDKVQKFIIEYLEKEAQNIEERYNPVSFLSKTYNNFINLYYSRFDKREIKENLITHQDRLDLEINEKILSIAKNNSPLGIYLYGSVGRGKTMLIKAFFDRINIPKEMIHFQSFMQEMHQNMHNLHIDSKEKIIEDLAKGISDKCKLLIIDEFEIKDIVDAMLVMRLFKELAKMGVFICITTNIEPQDLYKNGLQRELFLPCIKHIEENFNVLYLDSSTDYRFQKYITTEKRIFYPISGQNNAVLSEIKNCLMDYAHEGNLQENSNKSKISKYITATRPKSITVFGRSVNFNNCYKDCLFTDFSELICKDFGYADYVNICQEFNVIVLEGVEKIREDETDKITRLINFIDNAYFYKILLFISLEFPPEEIYMKGFRIDEFQRSISRLFEMNSKEYFDNINIKL